MGLSDNDNADWLGRRIRSFLSLLDRGVYWLLVLIYQIFFNVASTTILQGSTLRNFFARIQIILGVFVLFKLAINLIHVIVNPDQLGSDKSGQGFSQIVVRVIIALVMLVAVMPLNIPNTSNTSNDTGGQDSYNANLNANGLLFGTLYEFQERVLQQNVLAKLIIGSPNSNAEAERENMKNAGNQLASVVLKGFVRINIKPGIDDPKAELNSDNWMCPNAIDPVQGYLSSNVSPGTIIDMLTYHCSTGDGERFVFTYTPFVGAIIGAIFVFIIVGFTLDIAIRAIKLAILRLIAPIPIISYIDPKSSKDGAFAAWGKAVMTTYLDLFLRLAIVYFVIFIIQDIIINGIDLAETGTAVGIISVIFIILGLLFFARQAPKFITSALGIKSSGMGGLGVSGLLAGAAALVGGAGFTGAGAAALTAMDQAADAQAQGKAAPGGWSTGRDLAAQLKTGDPKARGGLVAGARDRLARGAGIRIARRYGVTASSLADAKRNMYNLADRASMSKDLYDRFVKDPNSLTSTELQAISQLRTPDGQNIFDESALTYVNGRANLRMNNAQREAVQEVLQRNVYTTQSAAAKAKSSYEKASKFGDSHRISTSFEEEFRPSLRENIERVAGDIASGPSGYMARRPDRRGEHQTLGDRLVGQNRWSANTQSTEGGNQQTDNPDTTMNSV